MKAICLTAFNRPHYFKRALRSLIAMRDLEQWEIFISIDPSDKIQDINAIINEIKSIIPLKVTYNEKRLGVRGNPINCLQNAYLQGADSFLLYEEDIETSQDSLEFISYCLGSDNWDEKYNCGNLHLSTCCNTAHLNNHFNHLYENAVETFFLSSLGLFFSKIQYERFISINWWNKNLLIKNFDGDDCEGWDLALNDALLQGTKPCLQSLVPRVRHFGEIGIHSTEDWHKTSYAYAGLYLGETSFSNIKIYNINSLNEEIQSLHEWGFLYKLSEQLWRSQKTSIKQVLNLEISNKKLEQKSLTILDLNERIINLRKYIYSLLVLSLILTMFLFLK